MLNKNVFAKLSQNVYLVWINRLITLKAQSAVLNVYGQSSGVRNVVAYTALGRSTNGYL